MKDKFDRMKELIHILSEASKAYYQENRELMSNFEYDKLYDELLELEKETDTVLANSPSVHVGYELLKRWDSWKNGWETKRAFCHGNWTGLPLSLRTRTAYF